MTAAAAESPTFSQRVESTSHSSRPRFCLARVVTFSPRHVSVVSVESKYEGKVAPLVNVARMIGWRLRTTARFPAGTGVITLTVGYGPTTTAQLPVEL